MSDQQQLPRRYRRPRRLIFWPAMIVGLALGIAGALYFAWTLAPLEEFNTRPWQLSREDRDAYMIAIALNFAYDRDINRALDRLLQLQRPGEGFINPFDMVAQTACELARTEFISTNNGRQAILSMQMLYQSQGRVGCADEIIVASVPVNPVETLPAPPTATPTLVPPASKTPTPPLPNIQPTPIGRIVPTTPPQRDFALVRIEPFCDTEISGVIEVYVQESNGEGIPGMPVRVRWENGEDTFFTGLKPERGPAYADFKMQANFGYIIEMPGRSDPSPQPLAALPCTTASGAEAIQSYYVVFRPVAGGG